MLFARCYALPLLAAALVSGLDGRALAQSSDLLIYDSASGQYFSFAPDGVAASQLDACGQASLDPSVLPWTAETQGACLPADAPSAGAGSWFQRFSIYAGIHGFKGPLDLGRSANFGFHEGINFGAPLYERFNLGCQVGVQASHSNFKGNQLLGEDEARTQVFLTTGVFHRSMDFGLQSGVVFDYFHDEFYDNVDLMQIRSENALRLGPWREIGYWGAYNIGGDFIRLPDRFTQPLKPEDLFALFYRRHFTGGGQGRVWAGLSGYGNLYLGAEATVPLGTSWSLENNFGYLLPKEDSSGRTESEVWAVSIRLVWYPGRLATHVFLDDYQPMLNVADNSVFMVKRQ